LLGCFHKDKKVRDKDNRYDIDQDHTINNEGYEKLK